MNEACEPPFAAHAPSAGKGLLLRLASPCAADFEAMNGDMRRRHCSQCRREVHDLSAMSRTDAEALLREAGGELCVRFQERPDGTVQTLEPPPRVPVCQRLGRWWARAVGIAAGVVGLATACQSHGHADAWVAVATHRRMGRLASGKPPAEGAEWTVPEMPAPVGDPGARTVFLEHARIDLVTEILSEIVQGDGVSIWMNAATHSFLLRGTPEGIDEVTDLITRLDAPEEPDANPARKQ
jgi:hypothetical protein